MEKKLSQKKSLHGKIEVANIQEIEKKGWKREKFVSERKSSHINQLQSNDINSGTIQLGTRKKPTTATQFLALHFPFDNILTK